MVFLSVYSICIFIRSPFIFEYCIVTFWTFHLGREKIVLISTHIVSDVESIASDILLMKKGKIIKNDTPTSLIHSIKGYVKEIPIDDLYYKKIKNHYKDGVFMQRSGGLQYRIVTDDKMDSQFTLDEEHINLEDVYLYYVQ
jgi:ABC-type multidrug transport system ATPase subunit